MLEDQLATSQARVDTIIELGEWWQHTVQRALLSVNGVRIIILGHLRGSELKSYPQLHVYPCSCLKILGNFIKWKATSINWYLNVLHVVYFLWLNFWFEWEQPKFCKYTHLRCLLAYTIQPLYILDFSVRLKSWYPSSYHIKNPAHFGKTGDDINT